MARRIRYGTSSVPDYIVKQHKAAGRDPENNWDGRGYVTTRILQGKWRDEYRARSKIKRTNGIKHVLWGGENHAKTTFVPLTARVIRVKGQLYDRTSEMIFTHREEQS